jgi:ribA/ribD-fused uncharacterized protein
MNRKTREKAIKRFFGTPEIPEFDPEKWIEHLEIIKTTLTTILAHDTKTRASINTIDAEATALRAEIIKILVINQFRGKHMFLSNSYNIEIDYEGIIYPSVEHAYQAAKCSNSQYKERIQQATISKAKKLGRYARLVDGWEDKRLSIMKQLLRIKFSDPYLGDLLLQTYPAKLIEGTEENPFWGGKTNHLGRLLMEIRKDLRSQS